MLQEREHNMDLINVLKGEITFLREEIKHKNDVIHKLLNEAKVSVVYDQKQSIHSNIVGSGINSKSQYMMQDDNSPHLTNYIQRQHIDDAQETSVNHDINDLSYVNDPVVNGLSDISSNESFFNDSFFMHSSPSVILNHTGLDKQLSDVRSIYYHDFLKKG